MATNENPPRQPQPQPAPPLTPPRNSARRFLWTTLAVLLLLAAAYALFMYYYDYSSGERAGWVQKFSRKGWLCKTWEGELALVTMPGTAQEKFYFTVWNDEVAERINRAMGKRVSLHYVEKVGIPTSCFGETRHYVDSVKGVEDIPLAPGIVVPNPQAGTAAPGSAVPAAPPAPTSPQTPPPPTTAPAPAPAAPPAPGPATQAPPAPAASAEPAPVQPPPAPATSAPAQPDAAK